MLQRGKTGCVCWRRFAPPWVRWRTSRWFPDEGLMSVESIATTRWVYAFGGGDADGDASMKNLLGGKGANLAEMSALGLPVPPGFTITTEACNHYYLNAERHPDGLA